MSMLPADPASWEDPANPTWTELLTFLVTANWGLDRIEAKKGTCVPRSVEQLLTAEIETLGEDLTMGPEEHATLLAALLQWEAYQ